MATVTGGGSTTFINVGSNDANGVAQTLANVISAGLANGTLTRVPNPQTNPPTGAGVATISTSGAPVVLNAPGVSVDLINATSNTTTVGGASQNIVGSGLPNQMVIGDNENIRYFDNGGGGSFIFGDGNDIFGTPTVGGGVINNVQTGRGNDTINIYSGLATVSAGLGSNVINTGTAGTFSNTLIFASGNDQIRATSGALGTDTVIGGNGATFISHTTKGVVYNGQGGTGSATIDGGVGSVTALGGSGGGVFGGGSNGNNQLFGGFGATSLYGGGNNDLLMARTTTGSTVLVAAAGNETLSGAGSTTGNTFIAGLGGNTTIGGGTGNDTIYVGNPGTTGAFGGSIVIDGGLGNDIISFTNRGSGVTAQVLINNFVASASENDQIQLLGYGTDQRQAITNAAGSASSVTLSDGTRITFGTAVNLNNTNFA